MNNIEILNKLKETLKSNLKSFMAFADNTNYTEVTTTDGKKLQVVGEVAVGSEVYILDDAGVQTPLEDGEYVLDNGLTISVMANKIDEVSSSTEEASDTETDMTAPQEMADNTNPTTPEDTTSAPTEDTTGTDKIAALEEKVAMLEEAIQSIMDFINTQGDANQQMMSRIEKIADSPAAEPIKQKKVYTLSSNPTAITKGDMDEIRKMKELFSDKGVKFPG